MAGLRDVLTHAYFSLEEQTLWDIGNGATYSEVGFGE
ncbi:MAG: hypothetical protein F6K41_26970 [Symploca sp. SIO3E6]|nr:hypothetical protein [Caldora sp. SIO3E6]